MLSYLTDVTLLWAASLLSYTFFFRKTTFHSWNRALLLGTLLAGLLLPFWPTSVPETIVQMPQYLRIPAARISSVKADAIRGLTADVQPAASFSLWTFYALGCVIAAAFYLRSAVRLFRLVRKAEKRQISGNVFYETGSRQPPFSFFGKTFLTAADLYTTSDLNLILQHETRHGHFRHSVDVVFMALLRVALWFHPFVYLYDYLLKQVHEFQADAFARAEPQSYGNLLLQEATSNPFPLVHSFYHSPLKSRIIMLTKNASPALLKLKYLLLIPVLLLTVEACKQKTPIAAKPQKAPVGYQSDTSFVFNGNRFYQEASLPFYWNMDSSAALPTDTGNSFAYADTTQFRGEPVFYAQGGIYKMNDEPVYQEEKVTTPAQYKGSFKNAFEELLHRVTPALSQLPNGKYSLQANNVIVSKEGKLVYYKDCEISNVALSIRAGETNLYSMTKALPNQIPETVSTPVNNAIQQALAEGFDFNPALLNGKPVNSVLYSLYDNNFQPVIIFVRNGKVNIISKQELAQVSLEEAHIQELSENVKGENEKLMGEESKRLFEAAKLLAQQKEVYAQEAQKAMVQTKAAEAAVLEGAVTVRKARLDIDAHWKALSEKVRIEKSSSQ